LESLHDLVMVWLVLITITVLLVSYGRFSNFFRLSYYESEALEKIWTLLPMAILVTVGIPRIRLLCLQDSFYVEPKATLKVTRNQ